MANEYFSKGETTKITISSRASVNIGKNYYTFEYSEERSFPQEKPEDFDIEKERQIMWQEANMEVDNQIKDVVDFYQSQQNSNY